MTVDAAGETESRNTPQLKIKPLKAPPNTQRIENPHTPRTTNFPLWTTPPHVDAPYPPTTRSTNSL
ncbi:hypothetical protein SAMN04487818_11643 [Actinokineospora terrae]|uniref:Uncharacterized protein n=1 Tax=Actinokineospora terrae TaxID=155974 RepID=A0A1H9XL25_9PSEU|nr:hypothetical protein SAMN04487818_11643 [Actinokineospora terrae]